MPPRPCSGSGARPRRVSATSPARSTSRGPVCTPTSPRRRTSCGRSSIASPAGSRRRLAWRATATPRPPIVSRGAAAPPVRFAGLVRGHVGVVVSDVGQASVFVHEWRHLSGPRRQAVLLRRDAYEGVFRDVIRDGIADGSFVMTDPSLAATFVLTALNGITGWYRADGHVGPTQLGDVYADLAVRSLTAAPIWPIRSRWSRSCRRAREPPSTTSRRCHTRSGSTRSSPT